MGIKVKKKKGGTKMYPEELRQHYEQIKGSGRISRVDTKYRRNRDKKGVEKTYIKGGDHE
jgi:hypothetical protein